MGNSPGRLISARCLALLLVVLRGSLEIGWAETPSVVVLGTTRMVRLRSEPRLDPSTEFSVAPGGSNFVLVTRKEGWFEIRLPEGGTAWVAARVAAVEPAQGFVEVVVDGTAYSTPAPSSESVEAVYRGQILRLGRSQEDWTEVRFPRNRTGWVLTASLRSLEESGTTLSGTPEEASQSEPASAAVHEPLSLPPLTPLAEVRDHVAAGRFKEAEDALRIVLAAEPDNGEIHFELAGLLDRSGRLDEAASEYSRAGDLGFRREEANQRISEIRIQDSTPPDGQVSPATPEPDLVPQEAEPRVDLWQSVKEWAGNWWETALGLLLVAVVGIWWWRKRRLSRLEQLLAIGRRPDSTESRRDAVVASAANPQLKSLDAAMAAKLREMQGLAPQGQTTSASAVPDELIGKLDEVRAALSEQEKRIRTLTDLLALQNQKIALLEEENQRLQGNRR